MTQTPEVLADRFEIIGELGRGGYSIVHEARDRKLDQVVALKVLVPPPVAYATAIERLRREVRAIRAISHPNIVTVYDLVEAPDRAFVVMEKIKGRDLAAEVSALGPLDAGAVAKLGIEIASALTSAHRHGILHRDLKPQNILVEAESKRARLVDFGSARLEGEASLTRTGAFVGTLDYAAPEALAGKRADARSDVFGLGMTLFFAASGRLPDRPASHLPPAPSTEGHRPSKFLPSIPSWLDAIVAQATRTEARERFPTTELLSQALEAKKIATPTIVRSPFCLVCGRTEPTHHGVCRKCEDSGKKSTGFVFLAPHQTDVQDRLKAFGLNDLAPEVANGERALVVSGESSRRVSKRLSEAGIQTTISENELAAVKNLPQSFRVMTAAVMATGAITATLTGSLLGVAGIPLGLVLLGLGLKSAVDPAVKTKGVSSLLPKPLEVSIERALASIESPSARDLLFDAVDLAKSALEPTAEARADDDVAPRIHRLLEVSIDACKRIAKLDEMIAALGRRKDGPVADSLEKAERARDSLQQQMLEMLANFLRAQSTGSIRAAVAAQDLEERNRQLRQELESREAAIKELSAILGENP